MDPFNHFTIGKMMQDRFEISVIQRICGELGFIVRGIRVEYSLFRKK